MGCNAVLLDFNHSQFFFKFTSEIVEPQVIAQFLEGLEFMHEHGIAQRDACTLNLMVESQKLIPNGHFDFFLPHMEEDWSTCRYPLYEANPLCTGIYGQARDVPEMSKTEPYSPFKLEVYQIGTALDYLIRDYEGIAFL